MNKLFSKVAALSVGLAMAIGVGVAVGSKEAKVAKASDTIVFNTTNSQITATGTDKTITVSGVTLTFSNISAIDASYVQNAKNATIISTELPGTIVSVKVYNCATTSSKTDGGFTVYGGTSSSEINAEIKEITGLSSTASDQEIEFAGNYTFFKIVNGSARVLKHSKIEITYGEAAADMTVKNSSGTQAPFTVNYGNSGALFYAYDSSNNQLKPTWTVSDDSVLNLNADFEDGHCWIRGYKPGTANLIATLDGYKTVTSAITINPGDVESLTISGSMSKTSYSTAESWSPAGFTVTASYDTGWEADVTSSVAWTYSPSAPAEGVTSVVANATLGEDSVISPVQSVTVSVAHEGTADDPFTVAEALAKCTEIGAVGNKGQGPWVTTGIISRVTSAPAATFWNATYYISDDGSQNNELQVYRGFYLDNAKFDAETAQLMKAGMIVTVTGNLTGSYGSEYCQGNYLLSIESPSTGDVDVVFEPTTSFEIGDTGTFTASSETSGVVFSWEVEDSSILSVNASSGAYEALALGVTKVTVTATAGGKEGSASAYITVNGASYMTVNAANELAATVPTGQTTGYYVYVEGFVSAFDVDSKTRALNITSKGEDSTIMVFVGASGYSSFIDGLQVGMCLRVKANVQNYNGTYELTNPVKEYSEYVAMTFAREFLDSTDAICEGYDGVSSNKAALEAIWSGFETKYDSLTTVQQNTLLNPDTYDVGSTVKDAMARYDYLTGKYELDNFVGRTPVVFAHVNVGLNDVASDNNTMIIVVVIAAVSALAFTTLLVFKKKKQK